MKDLQRQMDSTYTNCISILNNVDRWVDYPRLYYHVKPILAIDDYNRIVRISNELQYSFKEFLEAVNKLDDFDLVRKMKIVTKSMLDTAQTRVRQYQNRIGEIEEECRRLARGKARLDAILNSWIRDCEHYANEWNVLHRRLKDWLWVSLSEEQDIHELGYLRNVVEAIDKAHVQLESKKQLAAAAADFVRDWLDALANASTYEKNSNLYIYNFVI